MRQVVDDRDDLAQALHQLLDVRAEAPSHDVRRDRRLRPVLRRAQLARPAPEEGAVEIIPPGDPRRQRLEGRRLHDGRLPLGHAHVGHTVHRHSAVRAGQAGRPLDGVVPIVEFVLEGDPFAARAEPPAHVLDDDDVALPGGPDRVEIAGAQGQVLAVGQPGQEHRIAPVLRGAVDVGQQRRPVAHRRRHVELDRDLVDRLGGHAGPPAGGTGGWRRATDGVGPAARGRPVNPAPMRRALHEAYRVRGMADRGRQDAGNGAQPTIPARPCRAPDVSRARTLAGSCIPPDRTAQPPPVFPSRSYLRGGTYWGLWKECALPKIRQNQFNALGSSRLGTYRWH